MTDSTPHRQSVPCPPFHSSLAVSKQGSIPYGLLVCYPDSVPRHGVSSEGHGATPALLSTPHARWEAYRTQDRRQILARMLGVRNRSDRGGVVCAASSSSCMVDLKTFNDSNSTPVSWHSVVGVGGGKIGEGESGSPRGLKEIL